MIDPGFGLGKRKEQNTELLSAGPRRPRRLSRFRFLPSGKPFMTTPQADTTHRLRGCRRRISAGRRAISVRTYVVAGIRAAVLLADELMRGVWSRWRLMLHNGGSRL